MSDSVMSQPAATEAFIQQVPFFSGSRPAEVAELSQWLASVPLRAGEVLFCEGERAAAMWVLAGTAEVTVTAAGLEGVAVEVAYLRAGDVLGEMALVDQGPRSGTATVTRAGDAFRLDAESFRALRAADASIAYRILRRISVGMCLRLRQANERLGTGGARAGTSRAEVPLVLTQPSPETLDEFPPLRRFPALVKLALAQKLQLVEVDAPTPIFGEGEEGDAAYFILSGAVDVVRQGVTLATLEQGNLLGIVACIDDGVRSASCVTRGPARLLRMSNTDFEQLFESGHRFAFRLIDLIARELVTHIRAANRKLDGQALDDEPLVLGLDQALPEPPDPLARPGLRAAPPDARGGGAKAAFGQAPPPPRPSAGRTSPHPPQQPPPGAAAGRPLPPPHPPPAAPKAGLRVTSVDSAQDDLALMSLELDLELPPIVVGRAVEPEWITRTGSR